MKDTLNKSILLFLLSFLLGHKAAFSSKTKIIESQAESEIQMLYQQLDSVAPENMTNRIEWFSRQFKGKPYLLSALGEGADAAYDQFPRYRTDAFDCLTYVSTVLALALSDNFKTFQNCLPQVRYQNGQYKYLERNHFTSLDWNLNNQKKGFIRDYTHQITDLNHQPVMLTARTEINKEKWYQFKKLNSIRLEKQNYIRQQQKLKDLKHSAAKFKPEEAVISYIPLSKLFDTKGDANQHLFKQIPHGSIIEIVRPNWNLTKQIGTSLHVSHIGFAIRKGKELYYREASSSENKIIDISLIAYLRAARQSPTIKGINIQIMERTEPFSKECKTKKMKSL